MSAVVVPAYLLFGGRGTVPGSAWYPVLGLTLMTCLSRLALFLGVKWIGGMQTAVLGLAEVFVAVLFSYLWLHEALSAPQWLGALGLGVSLLLVRFEERAPRWRPETRGWLSWIRPPSMPRGAPWGPHE
jgi:drug/metabolite transporter (DMT)-like permease